MSSDELKEKIKEQTRKLTVKFDDETELDVFVDDKQLAERVHSSVDKVDLTCKKPKAVAKNSKRKAAQAEPNNALDHIKKLLKTVA